MYAITIPITYSKDINILIKISKNKITNTTIKTRRWRQSFNKYNLAIRYMFLIDIKITRMNMSKTKQDQIIPLVNTTYLKSFSFNEKNVNKKNK